MSIYKGVKILLMENNRYDRFLDHSPMGYAYHRIIIDDKGVPVDYVFMEANKTFGELTGLNVRSIIGKKVTEVLPGIKNSQFNWIRYYGEIALRKGKGEIEQYSEHLKKWYKVHVVSPEKMHFATYFTDQSLQIFYAQEAKKLHDYNAGNFDLRHVTETIRQIAGAQYAVFNRFNPHNRLFTSAVVCGVSDQIMRAVKILGMPLEGKEWPLDEKKLERLNESKIAHISDFTSFVGPAFSEKISSLIKKAFPINEVVMMRLKRDKKLKGDFTLIYTANHIPQNLALAENYADNIAQIMNRFEAEKELQRSKERYEKLAWQNKVITWEMNYHGLITWISPVVKELYGYTPQELIGQSPEILYYTPWSKEEEKTYYQILKDNKVLHQEILAKRKDGSTFISDYRIMPMIDDKGNTTGYIGVQRDITSRKNTEEELRARDALLRKLSEQLPGMIYQYQYYPDGRNFFPYASDSIYYVYEVTPSEVKTDAAKVLDRLHPEDYQPVMNSIRKSYQTLTRWDAEYRVVLPQKGLRWLRGTANPEKQSDGSVLWHGYIADITARKNAEETIRENEKLLKSILKTQKEMICRFDPDTTISYCNLSYSQSFGKKPEEITGKKWIEMIPSKEHPRIKKHLKSLREKKSQPTVYEHEVYMPDGSLRWQEWTDYAICDKEGNFLEFQSVGQDVTDRKQKEHLEKEVEVSRSALRFKQNFLASMSHEMRTPLTAIHGITQILQSTSLDENQRNFASILSQSTEDLTMIIDQVLDYARLESGKIQITTEVHPLKDLCQHAARFFESICHKPIAFHHQFHPDLPLQLQYDKNRIYQIINHLLINAVKFTHEGSVTFSVSSVHQKKQQENTMLVKVEITDTGVGIRKEKQAEMFSPFSQIHEIETENYKSIGLGLAICKEIARLHGGDMGLRSTHGKGTTIWFTFHALQVDATANVLSDTSTLPENLHILFAEDKTTTQKVVKLLLNNMGYRVSLASNGLEVINRYNPEDFDLILMDIQMPIMDGISATQAIKKRWKNAPPIVGLSANAFQGDREKYMNLGMDEYLTKPFKRDQFKKVLSRVFKK